MTELVFQNARDVVAQLKNGDISPHDALDALEARIAEVDTRVNALPTTCFERARAHADRLIKMPPDARGILAGLPVPIKDLNEVSGVRTTFGSRVMENYIPEFSDVLVDNLEENGGIVYAKSNTPEFGAGGNTFNDVFGITRNPHDLRLTAGGSSGGAAAALASGTAWLAHGSDLAGSLRTPASFCGVTSLRPSPGLIATGPGQIPFFVHPTQGPMARDIADLALFTDAMAGASHKTGLCKPRARENFCSAAAKPIQPTRIAVSDDLGITQTSSEVLEVFHNAINLLHLDGIDIVKDHPGLGDAEQIFSVPRALMYATLLGANLDQTRDLIKPEVVWNVEEGLALDGNAIRSSIAAQGRLFQHVSAFMQNYDLLICPAAIVPPFQAEERYPGFSDGVPANEYFRWLAIVYCITATTLPVITIPCGKTAAGLPVGIQLIGAPHSERKMFSFASYLEQLLPAVAIPSELYDSRFNTYPSSC